MATKKSSTSKTARVMNLLSKSREEPAPVEEAAAPVAAVEESAPAAPAEPAAPDAAVAAPVHAAPTPPIITAMQADSAISNQVMSALEDALGSELGAEAAQAAPVQPESAPEPTQEVPVEPAPVQPESAPVSTQEKSAAEPTPVPMSEPAQEEPVAQPAPVQPESAPVPTQQEPVANAPATPAAEPVVSEAELGAAPVQTNTSPEPENEPSPPTQFKVDPNTTYVNVMEALVEEKATKYIDMFGLCKCHRCVADVKAYALNHLVPKYVVMRTGEVIPRITLYEGQFSADVTAQILTACKVVMANPRHDL